MKYSATVSSNFPFLKEKTKVIKTHKQRAEDRCSEGLAKLRKPIYLVTSMGLNGTAISK